MGFFFFPGKLIFRSYFFKKTKTPLFGETLKSSQLTKQKKKRFCPKLKKKMKKIFFPSMIAILFLI